MPTYTYTCTACNDLVEKRQSFADPPLTTCEQCGGTLRKIIHPVGIVFKGSGWYITDSRSSTASTQGTSSSPAPSESSGSKDSGAKDSTPSPSAASSPAGSQKKET